MEPKDIKQGLREIGRRLSRLESVVFSQAKDKSRPASRRGALSSELLRLQEAGFFTQPKTAKEAHTKLQTRYPCELNRVAVGLLRLQKSGRLRRASKIEGGKKQVAYVW
jgi:hypothetical protein